MVEGTTGDEEIKGAGMTLGHDRHLAGVGMNHVDMAMIVSMNVDTPEIDMILEIEKAPEIGSSLETVETHEISTMPQKRIDHLLSAESHRLMIATQTVILQRIDAA